MKTPLPSYLLAASAFLAATAFSPAAGATALHWEPCDETLVGGAWPELGERLQCATLSVPVDHADPSGFPIRVGVVRIAAANPAQREGSLFINIGGPGGQPARYVSSLAAYFSEMDGTHPLHGGKRRLVERNDIVAVIPRGLRGGSTFDCLSGLTLTHAFLPTARDDANWNRFVNDARAEATACGSKPGGRFLSTMQHVHDMEAVRAALGDETIRFYGISYGGRVGAWYAATYPGRVERMLLDSSIDVTRSFKTATALTLEAERSAFQANLLEPILENPQLYGQPGNREALAWAMRDIHPEVRAAWRGGYIAPAYVAAALTLNRWIQKDGWRGIAALERKASHFVFSPDADIDLVMGSAAFELLERARVVAAHTHGPRVAERFSGTDPHAESLNIATLCNDEPWFDKPWQVRARADNDASAFPLADGMHLYEQLVCGFWPVPRTPGPALEQLAALPPFVIVQAEDDAVTPWRGAHDMLARLPSAHLITVRESAQHGLLGQSDTPCVERDALDYLLDGTLPASRESVCTYRDDPGDDDANTYETPLAMSR